MAIVKLGATVVGIRGTLGGITFSANKAGPYARIWTKGANPRTPTQSVQRGYVSEMPQAWRALTPVQQAAWDTWAALPAQQKTNSLGLGYYISGYAWFVCINTRLRIMGLATRTAPPAGARPPALTATVHQYDDQAPGFRFVLRISNVTDVDNGMVLFARAIPTSGRAVNYSAWRNIGNAPNIGFDPTAWTMTAQHLAAWGEAAAGWRIYISVHEQTDEGLRAPAATDWEQFPHP